MKWFFRCWLLVLPIAGHAQAPVWLWATGFTGSSGVQMRDIASASNNGCFALGSFGPDLYLPFDTLVSAGGAGTYFVAHVDTLGAVTWAAQFSDRAASMHGLPNDGLSCLIPFVGSTMVNGQAVTATTSGHAALVVELDNTGSITSMISIALTQWPAVTTPTRIVHHTEGSGIVLADTFADSVSVGGTWLYGGGLYLARFTGQGALLWAEHIGCGSPVEGSVHIDAEGRTLIGIPIGCDPDPDDPFFGIGPIVSYGPTGSYQWHRPYVLNEFGPPPVMSRRPNGNALVSASFLPQGGGSVTTTMELDEVGAEIWTNQLSGPTTYDRPISIHAIGNGSTLLSGDVLSTYDFGPWTIPSSFGPDGFVASIDGSGNWQWATAETSGEIFTNHAAPGTNSRIYTSGFTGTGASLGSHWITTNMGSFTGFVACLGDVTLNTPDTGSPFETLLVWPNPTTSTLHLSQRFGQGQMLRIINPSGRTIESRPLDPSATTIDISDLGAGIYLLRIGEHQARIVKQ